MRSLLTTGALLLSLAACSTQIAPPEQAQALHRDAFEKIRSVYLFDEKLDGNAQLCANILDEMIIRGVHGIPDEAIFQARKETCFDRYTRFMPSPLYATPRGSDESAGIGILMINICKEDHTCTFMVTDVTEGTPADRAGLKPDDMLIATQDTGAEKILLKQDGDEDLISGPSGSNFTLWYMRDGKERTATLTRTPIQRPSATAKNIGDVCFVEITHFSLSVSVEFDSAVATKCAQPVRYMILDLRNNLGGEYQRALETLYAFSNDPSRLMVVDHSRAGTVVRTIGNPLNTCDEMVAPNICAAFFSYATFPKQAKLPGTLRHAHVAILVNSISASAAEIVAGALQSWQRSGHRAFDEGLRVVFGKPTVGKIFGQDEYSFHDGSVMRITSFEFEIGYRGKVPAGTKIIPDVMIEDTRAHSRAKPIGDPVLRSALEWLHTLQ